MTTKSTVSAIAVFLLLVALVGFLGRQNPGQTTPNEPTGPPPLPPGGMKMDLKHIAAVWPQLLRHAAAPPLGSATAPYTIVEIGDFQCPNCGQARPLVESAFQSSQGKACMYFVNMPLPNVHPHAMAAAEAGLAAAAQGKFWPMYDLLYDNQDTLIPSEIEYNARSIPGLNSSKVAAAMRNNTFEAAIRDSIKYAESLGVSSTPTIFVRDPKGVVTMYLGTRGSAYLTPKGTAKAPGVVTLAATPPWGNGIGPRAQQILDVERQKALDGPGDDE
jgi:hypothetical protein